MIPRIIHQTWKSRNVPERWRANVETFRRFHPDWEYRLWTDDDNDAFVASRFPEFLARWRAYPYAILRADAIRYLLLLEIGGVYADLDCECLQPLDPFLDEDRFIAGREPEQHERNHGVRGIPSNALMIAPPENRVCRTILAHLVDDERRPIDHKDVLETTGPLMLRRVLEGCSQENYRLEDARAFSPLASGSRGMEALRNGGAGAEKLRDALRASGSFAVHCYDNSWTATLAGDLINPEPDNVPGFTFVKGLFFRGYDSANAGRDVAELSRTCLGNEEAVGFNTDGFIKSHCPPPHEWLEFGDCPDNVGTYLKDAVFDRVFGDRQPASSSKG